MGRSWTADRLTPLFKFLAARAETIGVQSDWFVKASSDLDIFKEDATLGMIGTHQFTIAPQSLTQLKACLDSDEYDAYRILWECGRDSLTIDIAQRAVDLATDSISFVELLRHELLPLRPRKFLIDLNMKT